MTLPRLQLIVVGGTPYSPLAMYGRAFLCGTDSVTGKNYKHRRLWIENRIRLLSSILALSVCGYAVMSNHIHMWLSLYPMR